MSETMEDGSSPGDMGLSSSVMEPMPSAPAKPASSKRRPRPPPPEDLDQRPDVDGDTPKFELPTTRVFIRYGDSVTLFDQIGSCGFLWIRIYQNCVF